jgi:hypothetical protein
VAEFILGIEGRYVDGHGVTREISTLVTPQRFALNLDLDIDPGFPASPLASDWACTGGPNSGNACDLPTDCPGLKADGSSATCDPLPSYLESGGTSLIAGEVGYYESFEGANNMGGRNLLAPPWPVSIPGTNFIHSPAIHGNGGYLDGGMLNYLDLVDPGPLTPGAARGNTPDDPEGTSAVDGTRCQYSDPGGPSKHERTEVQCRPWDGSDWHVNANKAFTGTKSLYYGIDGVWDLAMTSDWDTYHTGSLAAALSQVVNVGVAGNVTLSLYQIVQTADDRTFNLPAGQAADRAYVMAAEADPATGVPVARWTRIEAFQNSYSSQAVAPGYSNCVFQSYDAHYDSEWALSHTPGWNVAAASIVGVSYNADRVSSEDDYFDPNDPLRLLGPSEGCFPQFTYSSLGDHTSADPTDVGRAFTDGETGQTGTGVWVNSLFNLDRFAGKTIRLRFVFSGMEVDLGATWADILGPDTTNATRGWRVDDVAISGLVDAPMMLVPDTRGPFTSACPVDPDPGTAGNQDASHSITADAGPDIVLLAPGEIVELDGSASVASAEPSCRTGRPIRRSRRRRWSPLSTRWMSAAPPTMSAMTWTRRLSIRCRTWRLPDCQEPSDQS